MTRARTQAWICRSVLRSVWLTEPLPYQSLLLGQRANSWYNRFPMPYHRQAILEIDCGQTTAREVAGAYRARHLG